MYPEYAQPAAPVKKSRKPMIIALSVVGGLLLLCCGISAVAATVSPRKAAQTHFVTPSAAASAVATVAPVAVSPTPAAVKPSPTPAAPTPAEQLRAWFDAGGDGHLSAVSNALQQVADTTQAGDIQSAKAAAVGLGVAVKSAQAFAPMPDPVAQRFWAGALASYAASGKDLYVGLTTVDSSKIQKASNEMGDGATSLRHCTDRIREITGG